MKYLYRILGAALGIGLGFLTLNLFDIPNPYAIIVFIVILFIIASAFEVFIINKKGLWFDNIVKKLWL